MKPGSCPNGWNPGSRGVLPLAILGTADFDFANVDLASLRVEGVEPLDGVTEFAGSDLVRIVPASRVGR